MQADIKEEYLSRKTRRNSGPTTGTALKTSAEMLFHNTSGVRKPANAAAEPAATIQSHPSRHVA
jgi:hypothetical protein